MRNVVRLLSCAFVVSLMASRLQAQDWPQWRGPHRDGRAAAFQTPSTWPAELTKGWSVSVGDGVSTPALVGDRLYVYARQGGDEVLRCLSTATGDTLWEDRSPAAAIQGPASGFTGPRSSPTVADGKIVVLGVQGKLSCLNAATGEVLWRNAAFEGAIPRFATSSSPIVVDGLCIAQLGAESGGGVIALDLNTGDEKWKWTGDGPAYGSPILMDIGGTRALVVPTSRNMVALDTAGNLLWEIAYEQGRYNAATPIADGQTLIFAGPAQGITATKLLQEGDKLAAAQTWKNPDNSLMYNTPVLRDGLLFGLSNLNQLFCVDVQTGATAWSAPISGEAQPAAPPQDQGRGRRGGGRGRGQGGYGSVVDAGSVLMALTPDGTLVVFEPVRDAFKQIARYKVAERGAYAYPVASGNRIFIKDQDSVTLWTVQ